MQQAEGPPVSLHEDSTEDGVHSPWKDNGTFDGTNAPFARANDGPFALDVQPPVQASSPNGTASGRPPTVPSLRRKPHQWVHGWSSSLRRHNIVDLVLYVVFLVLFCAVELVPVWQRSFDAYRLVQTVEATLLEQDAPEPQMLYSNVFEVGGLMHWLQFQFYSMMWGFDPNSLPDDNFFPTGPQQIPGFYLAATSILGPVRIRQSRVSAGSCEVSDKWAVLMEQWNASCDAAYSQHTRARAVVTDVPLFTAWQGLDTTNLTAFGASGVDLSQAFTYRANTGAGWYLGNMDERWYGPEGFVVDLPADSSDSALIVADWMQGLREKRWLDGQTRAVFVEFSLYLAPQDLCLSVRLVFEVHPTGTIVSDLAIETFILDPYSSLASWEFWLSILLVLSVIVNIVFELFSLYNMRGLYARRNSATWVWIIAGVLVYVTVIAVLVLHVVSVVILKNLKFNQGVYFPTHKLGYLRSVERTLVSFCSFIVWFRLLKYTSQLPKIGILGRTIGKVIPQVTAFFFMSSVIFLAFAQTFFMVYYASVPGYQGYLMSLMSVLRFTVGDYNYRALSDENPIFTPIIFTLLLIILFFVWVNLVIAIISTVYESERELIAGFDWDPIFDKLEKGDIDHPEYDTVAVREHETTVPGDSARLAAKVSLHPPSFNQTPRFKRFLVRPLKFFDKNSLITVDMDVAFSANAGGDTSAQSLDRSRSLTAEIAPGSTLHAAISHHKGVFARLGTPLIPGQKAPELKRSDSARRQRAAATSHEGVRLQALYFDQSYHNLTTAQMWWKENKRFFDEGEQFMRDLTGNITRLFRPWRQIVRPKRQTAPGALAGSQTRLSVGGSGRMSSGGNGSRRAASESDLDINGLALPEVSSSHEEGASGSMGSPPTRNGRFGIKSRFRIKLAGVVRFRKFILKRPKRKSKSSVASPPPARQDEPGGASGSTT